VTGTCDHCGQPRGDGITVGFTAFLCGTCADRRDLAYELLRAHVPGVDAAIAGFVEDYGPGAPMVHVLGSATLIQIEVDLVWQGFACLGTIARMEDHTTRVFGAADRWHDILSRLPLRSAAPSSAEIEDALVQLTSAIANAVNAWQAAPTWRRLAIGWRQAPTTA
jgi:hypothetical protein